MKSKQFTYGIAAMAGLATLTSGVAFGAGFEKNILFSGKYAGRAGTGVSDARGAEALFFNPAGLASGTPGIEATGDFSPTWAKFTAPLTQSGVGVNGNTTYDSLYGAFASYNINEHWGFGVGSYAGAGAHAEYDGATLSYPGLGTVTNDVKARIYDTEASIGTGMEILPGLRLGAAWRATHVSATLNQLQATTSSIASVSFNDLGVWRYNGFRLGAQYTNPDNTWGLGVTWRTAVNFNTAGNVSGTVSSALTGGTPTAVASTPATLGSTLPSQVTVGGNYQLMPKTLKGFLEYVWTNYSTDQQLSVGGVFAGQTLPNQVLGFTNQSNIRLGFECTAVPNWVFRAGYVWTSQVTPNVPANPVLEPPAHADTITVGAGTTLIADLLEVNGAFEYDWVDGSGTSAQAIAGEYSAKSYDLHLGATVRF
ncbi:MAG: hypothetical protein P4M08_05460 [Oligoflexia bacterium]|nr:hypothetical protein [Oligoflexia bacterium]